MFLVNRTTSAVCGEIQSWQSGKRLCAATQSKTFFGLETNYFCNFLHFDRCGCVSLVYILTRTATPLFLRTLFVLWLMIFNRIDRKTINSTKEENLLRPHTTNNRSIHHHCGEALSRVDCSSSTAWSHQGGWQPPSLSHPCHLEKLDSTLILPRWHSHPLGSVKFVTYFYFPPLHCVLVYWKYGRGKCRPLFARSTLYQFSDSI